MADELDQAIAAFYNGWKERYVIPDAAKASFASRPMPDRTGKATTVFEGQGYGMVIVALMAGHDPEAQTVFDQLFHYARKHPSTLTGG